jgi:hypothetical protein
VFPFGGDHCLCLPGVCAWCVLVVSEVLERPPVGGGEIAGNREELY